MSTKTVVSCDVCGKEGVTGNNGDMDMSVNTGGNHYTRIIAKDMCKECATEIGKVAIAIKERSKSS